MGRVTVAEKFPILEVAKAALLMPFNSPVNMVKAIGLFIIAIILFAILAVGGFVIGGGDAAALVEAFEGQADPAAMGQKLGMMAGMGTGLIGAFLGLFILLGVSAHIFNYWVRFATFGKEGAAFGSFGKAVSAAAVNGLKFIFIVVLIVIASMVINFVLSSLGLSRGIMEQAAITDMTDQYLAGFTFNIIVTVVTCFAYSAFSANLTQTAIGNDEEGLEHPHTMDFAVVLLLVYATLVVPLILAALSSSDGLFMTVQYVMGTLILFAVPAAHGLRYRICSQENVSQGS
jgi:hypothetical protein